MWTDILHVIRSPPCPAQERISSRFCWPSSRSLACARSAARAPAVSLRKALGSTAPRDFGLSTSSGRACPSRRAPGEQRRGCGVRGGEPPPLRTAVRQPCSVRALWGYLSLSHQPIAPEVAAPGDVLFFDTRGTGAFAECADHAGIVESVDADGRIMFVEARGGQIRRSYVDPTRPSVRRSEKGAIANSFLRPKDDRGSVRVALLRRPDVVRRGARHRSQPHAGNQVVGDAAN